MPSVDPDDMLSDRVVMRDVSVVTDHMEFLRVATNDPHRQFLRRIRDIVDSFEFPLLYRRLPFTHHTTSCVQDSPPSGFSTVAPFGRCLD